MEGERNNLLWRVATLEREVKELRAMRPDVVADRVQRLSEELASLRRHVDKRFDELEAEMKERDKVNADGLEAQKRILIGAWVTIASGLIIAYVLGSGGAGVS